jgi:hypothetical protein
LFFASFCFSRELGSPARRCGGVENGPAAGRSTSRETGGVLASSEVQKGRKIIANEYVLTVIVVVASALQGARLLWQGSRIARRALAIVAWHLVSAERNETGHIVRGMYSAYM